MLSIKNTTNHFYDWVLCICFSILVLVLVGLRHEFSTHSIECFLESTFFVPPELPFDSLIYEQKFKFLRCWTQRTYDRSVAVLTRHTWFTFVWICKGKVISNKCVAILRNCCVKAQLYWLASPWKQILIYLRITKYIHSASLQMINLSTTLVKFTI